MEERQFEDTLECMKQAVNEAIGETLNEISKGIDSEGRIGGAFYLIEEKLKIK
jgi:hypothetical protein